jgi:predicted Zn-ribbon and HTH transcriptional regulator
MSQRLWKQVLTQGLRQTRQSFNSQQLKVLSHLTRCKTEAAGVEIYACDDCGYQMQALRSCRDRHCPSCQYRSTIKWCEARRQDILPITYYHLVFTLPNELNGWVSCYPEVIYRLLFESVWHTLSRFGQDKKRLNGQLGMLSVLHTWGQTLARHVHLHCLVPGGALGDDGDWHPAKSNYLFPVKALSRHYRGNFISRLREAKQQGLMAKIPDKDFTLKLDQLMSKEWVVYTKAASYGHDKLIDYLGRYTRRIALTPSRIMSIKDNEVYLKYRDYRDGSNKVMKLTSEELLRRYALHILPKGFMRVRYHGFLANAVRAEKLEEIRQVLRVVKVKVEDKKSLVKGNPCCPDCGKNEWHYVGVINRLHWKPG